MPSTLRSRKSGRRKSSAGKALARRRGRPPASPAVHALAVAESRDAIFAAAMKIFEKGGVDAINMRDIGKQLGTSQMMAYRYFPSKDHLLMEMRIRAFDRFRRSLARWRRRARTPAQALPLICGAYLAFAYFNPDHYRLMFDMWAFENLATMKAEYGEKVRRQSASWVEIQAAVTDYLGDEAADIDLVEATNIVWGSLHGLASLHLARKLVFGRSLRQLARPGVAAILAGVNSQRAAVQVIKNRGGSRE